MNFQGTRCLSVIEVIKLGRTRVSLFFVRLWDIALREWILLFSTVVVRCNCCSEKFSKFCSSYNKALRNYTWLLKILSWHRTFCTQCNFGELERRASIDAPSVFQFHFIDAFHGGTRLAQFSFKRQLWVTESDSSRKHYLPPVTGSDISKKTR